MTYIHEMSNYSSIDNVISCMILPKMQTTITETKFKHCNYIREIYYTNYLSFNINIRIM